MSMNKENAEEVSKVKVIFEDQDVLVINKPAGLVVHGDGRTKEETLADWLVENYPEIKSVGEAWEAQNGAAILRPGIVHRLDRETSGVMVIAKTQGSYEHLKSQFKDRLVQKEYRAIINGTFKDDIDGGVIEKSIGKSPSDFRKWSAQPGARGTLRNAVTEYKILSRVGVGNDGFAYIAAMPKTGRTHQIRVHFKAIHHSVLGDKLYGAKKVANIGVQVPRTMLHAFKIKFANLAGENVEFDAEIPKDFEKVLKYAKLSLND